MNLTAAFPVREPSDVGEPRRAATRLAERLEFPDVKAGQVALVVSELATNLVKHARAGELLLRPVDDGTGSAPAGIDILAVDSGPGIPEPALSRRDGYSTSGTLGHGLGSIERQSDRFELFTMPSGTVALSRIWRDPMPDDRHLPRIEVGAVHVSKPGEEICGDDWAWRLREERLAILLADGLGHGLQAHEAARAATVRFGASAERSPQEIIGDVHAALRGTRGAAVAALAVDLERGVARYSGLGNICATVLLAGGGRHSLVSLNGTAGHSAARLQEFTFPFPSHAMLVLHSDGLATHWDLAPYAGLQARHPSLIAGALYRDFSRRRDDVTVVVVKQRR